MSGWSRKIAFGRFCAFSRWETAISANASRLVPYSLYYDFTPIKAGSSSYGLIYKIALKSTLSGKYVCPAKF